MGPEEAQVLRLAPRTQSVKEKIDKLKKKKKDERETGRKYLHSNYSAVKKQTIQLENGQNTRRDISLKTLYWWQMITGRQRNLD